VGLPAVLALTVYSVPALAQAREGAWLAWSFPYDELYADSAGEWGWRAVLVAASVPAAFVPVKAVSLRRALPDAAANALALVSGLATAMVVMDQSQRLVACAHRVSKFVSYSIDGAIADVFGRAPGALSAWERDGLTVEAVLALRAAANKAEGAASSSSLAATSPAARAVPLSAVASLPLERCEELLLEARARRSAGASAGPGLASPEPESERAFERALTMRHQRLLVSAISAARAEEALARSGLQPGRLGALEARKLALKERCLRVHGQSLGRVWSLQLRASVDQLTALRRAQLELAEQSRAADASGNLLIRQRLRELDLEKHRLKSEAKQLFRVDISPRSQRVTPWKQRVRGAV
jgi:hypothetical protein